MLQDINYSGNIKLSQTSHVEDASIISLEHVQNGYYRILVNDGSGFLAMDDAVQTMEGAQVIMKTGDSGNDALWTIFEENEIDERGWYVIINKKSGKALSLDTSSEENEGVNFVVLEYVDGENQLWKFN